VTGRNDRRPQRVQANVNIEITDTAVDLLRRRGGTMAVDFIRPTG
jgi:hypothetical protein